MQAADVYRVLLWCYPARFRDEYGAEMLGAFSAQLDEARRQAGHGGAAAVWLTTLADLVPTAFREHQHVIRQDLRHALRILAASPGFTLVAVLSLALGIGANTAIFDLLNRVLLSTLPVRDPHQLVMLTDPGSEGVAIGAQGGARSLATYEEFQQLRERNDTFASLTAAASVLARTDARVAGGDPEEIAIRLVSGGYFATLGVTPAIGRTIDSDGEPTAGSAPHAVISYDYWQRRFGGDTQVIGRTIALRGGLVSIVGVMPAGFFGETVGQQPDAWVPLAMQAVVLPGRDWLHDRPGSVEKTMWLHLFGRLRPGVSREQAQANANVTFRQGLAAYYGTIADPVARAREMDQQLVLRDASSGASSLRRTFSEPLTVLLGAAALVLLIACANLGNMLLARTTARGREMAVRLALGASRGRLTRQLLTESLCLAAAGGIAGLFLAVLFRAGLLRLVATSTIVLPAGLDWRTAAFVAALTLFTGAILGLLPATRITQTQATAGLKEGRGVAGSATWLRVGQMVAVGQLALSLPLLVGSGLLVRTLVNLQHVDLGFPREGITMVRVDAQASGYDAARRAQAFDGLLAQVRTLPGVAAATYSNNGLFSGSDNADLIEVDGYTPTGQNGDRGSRYDAVEPGYFATLHVPLLLGRAFTEQDAAAGRGVCVINETFATRFFAGRNPLGQRVTQVYGNDRHTCEVVGVAADARQGRLREAIEHRFYTPVTAPAAAVNAVTFIIRTRGDAATVLPAVRRLFGATEPGMPILNGTTLDAAVNARIAQDRLLAQLSIAFGIVAVLLVAIGLYGVLSYGVSRRTNEIGVRKALGAGHGTVVAMILRETGRLLLVGLIAGGAAALAATRLITSRLHGVSATDPATLALAAAGLTLVAALAAWLPAYRAARVDAMVALRQE